MSATTQRVGGATLAFGGLTTGSVGSYVPIGFCKDITGWQASATIVDSTTQDITDNRKRKLGALVDEGAVTTEVWLDLTDTAGHKLILNSVGLSGYFTLTPKNYSTPEVATFVAVIQKADLKFPVDGGQMMSLTLDISGGVTIAP